MPTPLARLQVREALARASNLGKVPRVWCWADLWRALREGRDDGPIVLSAEAARAVLVLAIERARESGILNATAAVAAWPGFRRRLRLRIVGWTRLDLSPDREPPETGPTIADEWAIYGHYRAILHELRAEDADGFALWAAFHLEANPPDLFQKLGTITIVDPDEDGPAARRVLAYFEDHAKVVRVILGRDADPALADVDLAVAPLRNRLLDRQYQERTHTVELFRAAALKDIERNLFRSDADARSPFRGAEGLKLLGGPQGEGVALLLAREVQTWFDRGAAPEDILILVRHWNEDADAIVRVLQSWNIPVSAVGRPTCLASEPSVSALRLALKLGADGWEATDLVKFLRNSQFRPDWPSAQAADSRPRAASAIRDSGIYRGQGAILRALGDTASNQSSKDRRSIQARDLVHDLVEAIDPITRPGSWPEHVRRLKRLADRLGIDSVENDALERLGNALDDQAAVFDAINHGQAVPFREFVSAVESLVRDDHEVATEIRPGTVCVATVDRAAGARMPYVILANLSEGTFPTREAVESASDDVENPGQISRAYAREMARFLRVVGSASEELVLAYPTRDEKGQEILSAGFLDDLIRRFDPSALTPERHQVVHRFDPSWLDHPDLAVAPADARVRALALACLRHDPGPLARMATDPIHRPSLNGTSAALSVTAHRLDPRGFTRYDGFLTDPGVPAALVQKFGPDAIFSPSKLESYLLCPFQFFLKYVLKLVVVDDRDELDENFIDRGTRIHKTLEDYETLRMQGSENALEVDEFVSSSQMMVALSDLSEARAGLDEIERRRVEQTFRRYLDQARAYQGRPKEPSARPAHLEIAFGSLKEETPHPCIQLGEGAEAVRLEGKIDRVDVVENGDSSPSFRVIDYKTGTPPSKKDVNSLFMVQLPLYALAVERLGLAGATARPVDVGYWDLREKGYTKIELTDWPELKVRLEASIIDAVDRLRSGRFEVNPRKDDCTGYCDFASACRIGEIRKVQKGAGDSTR